MNAKAVLEELPSSPLSKMGERWRGRKPVTVRGRCGDLPRPKMSSAIEANLHKFGCPTTPSPSRLSPRHLSPIFDRGEEKRDERQ